jgi:hypothetical protein
MEIPNRIVSMNKVKNKKAKSQNSIKYFRIQFLLFSFVLFVIKISWLYSRPGHGMLGADGENYLEALDGLINEGFFSQAGKLSYWPAGYPILMWPIAELSTTNLVFIVGLIQSLFFAIVTAFFASELSQGKLKEFAWPSLLLLNLSPTLSLNSVVIGYEVSTACCFLLAITLYLRIVRLKKLELINWENFLASISLSVSAFVQPRTLVLAIGTFLPFALFHYRGKFISLFSATMILITSLGPAIMVIRNIEANGYAAISTNLGITMNIGAGPSATGGYSNNAKGVPCPIIEGNSAVQDRHKLMCVLDWYAKNPKKSVKLLLNKFIFHWSPWFGPLANGTMARNPWLDFNPFVELAQTSDGYNRVFGQVGKIISWIWIIASLTILVLGMRALRLRGGLSTLLAWMLFIPVLLNTMSSMATIGDHRFRIPTLTSSLLLQLFGVYALFSKRLFRKEMDGSKALIPKQSIASNIAKVRKLQN